MNIAMDLIREALLGGSGGGGGGGGDEGPLSDVMFYDYDGTVLQSYTKAEFLNLTEMPANPDHTADGLTAQGWNWTLEGAKALVNKAGFIDIGQLYHTDDDAMRLHLSIPADVSSVNRLVKYNIKPVGEVVVDWGDDSTDTATGTGSTTIEVSHTYASAGEFVISIKKTSGTGNYTFSLTNDGYGKQFVKGMNLGDRVTLSAYPYNFCNLEYVTFRTNTSTSTGNIFQYLKLKHVTLPKTVKMYGTMFAYSFIRTVAMAENQAVVSGSAATSHQNALFLKRAYLPDGYAGVSPSQCLSCEKVYVGEGAASISFKNFPSLSVLYLPSTVTTISNEAFNDCPSLSEVHIKATTPPTLTSFGSRFGTFTIYVPSASVADYKAASVWSNYADRIVGE